MMPNRSSASRSRSRAPVTPATWATRSGWTSPTRSPIWDALMRGRRRLRHRAVRHPRDGHGARRSGPLHARRRLHRRPTTRGSRARSPRRTRWASDWAVNLDKQGYFVGRRALEREQREGSAWKLVGSKSTGKASSALFAAVGLPPQIPAMAVRGSLPVHARRQAGRLRLDQHLVAGAEEVHRARRTCSGRITSPARSVTMEVTVEHHRRQAPGKVVKLPFYEPEWKKK